MKILKLTIAASSLLMATSAMADIRIAVIAPYTKGFQDVGSSLLNGVKLAAAEINAHGGIMGGQKITLVEQDDASTPDVGLKATQHVVGVDKVVGVLAFCNTGVAAKSIGLLQQSALPTIVPCATGNDILNPSKAEPVNYIFRISARDGLQTEKVADTMVAGMNAKRIAIFADSTPYGQGGLQNLQEALGRRSIKAIIVERYPVGQTDFDEATTRVRMANIDAAAVWGLGAETAAMRTSMNRVGMRTPVIGSWTLSQKIYADNAGPITDGSLMPVTFTLDTKRESGLKFIKNYREFNKTSQILSPMAASQGYDALYLMAMAIDQAGSTDAKKIVGALENLEKPFVGAVQDYVRPFSKTQHEAIDEMKKVRMGVVRSGITYEVR
jgi:branched-chain amino acid transport system substrate-binding protein